MIVVDGVDMVDVREAAVLVRRTPETVRRWVWSARLSGVKHGNKLLVPRSELLALRADEVVEADRAEPLTLSTWADEVERSLTGGPANSSARELVLADREARE